MIKQNSSVPIINGFHPVTVQDVECMANTTFEQAESFSTLFRSIARLSSDKEVMELCKHGALQADLQANDIDLLRERALKAGLVATVS